MNLDQNWLVDSFLTYAKIDTQSDSTSKTVPSTDTQKPFAEIVKKDCEKIGLSDIRLDQFGYLTATLPSNMADEVPVIGLLAHMDVVPFDKNFSIEPNIIKEYDGKEIHLSAGRILSPEEFPHLKDYVGKTLITTDGNTILGADDKAGISEILTAMAYFMKNPEIKHGKIRIAFTPDEEIGTGMNHFNAKEFGADLAFTVDSEGYGSLNYETFNAAKATITITGKNIHTGSAKGIMINAALAAAEIMGQIPTEELPQTTEEYEGFYHVEKITGIVDNAEINLIIRDHDKTKFENRKEFLKNVVEKINDRYGSIATVVLEDQYYNMAEKINQEPLCLSVAKNAMAKVGITPVISPVRGGTDGSKLTFLGTPCPNIFTGGHNAHGPYEYVCVESMVKATELIVAICEEVAQQKN